MQVLNLVPPRKLRLHRPRRKAKASVLPTTSEQVGTAAGGSGGQASHRSRRRKTALLSTVKFVLRNTR
jgi:hypothetical protein